MRVEERVGVRPQILVGFRILIGQPRADGLQLGARLLDRDAVGQPADGEIAPRLPRLIRDGGGHGADRQPDIGVEGKVHALGHDADDGPGDVANPDGSPDDGGVAAIALLPQRVADQHDRRRAPRPFAGRKVASEHRRYAERLEEVRRDVAAGDQVRDQALVPDVEGSAEYPRHARERAGGRAPVLEVAERDAQVASLRIPRPDEHDLVRIRQRQAAKQHGVDDREDRVVGADPQRQDHDGHEREPAVLDEQARRESNVPEEVHDWSFDRIGPKREFDALDAAGVRNGPRVG